MVKLMVTLLAAGLLSSGAAMAAPAKADFYVAVNGNDGWSGRLAAPNKAKTDGPFATLERARLAVRALKAGRKTPIRVEVRGGTYFLDKPLVFGPEDSGTAEAPIVYAAYANEHPVFSGGTRLTGSARTAAAGGC